MRILLCMMLLVLPCTVVAQLKSGDKFSKNIKIGKNKLKIKGNLLLHVSDVDENKNACWVTQQNHGVLQVYLVVSVRGKVAEVVVNKVAIESLDLDANINMGEGGMYGFLWLNVFIESKSSKNSVLTTYYLANGQIDEVERHELLFGCENKEVANDFIRMLKANQGIK